jgi:capsular polysaccharide biosynthesis protein
MEEIKKSEALDSKSLATEGTQEFEESSIDFKKIFADLLKHKMLYAKVLPITFVVAAILALSIPNYYNCTVKLSPEMSGSKSTSGLASLASSFGVNLGTGGAGTEALFPTLYPDLMNSVDFKTSLFHVPVTIEGDKEAGEPDRTMSYYDYLTKEQKSPWWSSAMKSIMSIFKSDSVAGEGKLDPFRLTLEQANVVKAIDQKVVCDVDKKTMVITINVTDQDPVIAANMADTVKTRLQNFITDYRTSKARVDLEYNRKITAETKARYEKARQLYAEFMDANNDIILATVRQKQTDLENEMQLQYNAYQQVAAQLLAAEAKVQEETPAFTTLQSATVPVLKAGPKRAQMCLIFVFLAFLGTTAWILYKEDDLKSLLGLS